MEVRATPWNNPDAGNHPLPDNPQESVASAQAGERCMAAFPYLGIRFGPRGNAFARTDSGYLATLIRFPQGYVNEQVRWLSRVLSNRGIPRMIMETHLHMLSEELANLTFSSQPDHNKLLHSAAELRHERQTIIAQKTSDRLTSDFAQLSGNCIPGFGELVVSAICDEACGIDMAVSSVSDWVDASESLPRVWKESFFQLIGEARLIARQN